jgi:hypothetical protein
MPMVSQWISYNKVYSIIYTNCIFIRTGWWISHIKLLLTTQRHGEVCLQHNTPLAFTQQTSRFYSGGKEFHVWGSRQNPQNVTELLRHRTYVTGPLRHRTVASKDGRTVASKDRYDKGMLRQRTVTSKERYVKGILRQRTVTSQDCCVTRLLRHRTVTSQNC